MNITLSVDEQVALRAREAAQKMGKSLNQVVRDYLEQLAGSARRERRRHRQAREKGTGRLRRRRWRKRFAR